MPNDDLDDKKKTVLNQIIDSYLIDGAPVGSKTLSNKSEEMASSSSLRNIMSQLEVMGLIYSPHVSSGRLPTEKGLRLYVDNLLAFQTIYNENDDTYYMHYKNVYDDCIKDEFNSYETTVSHPELIHILNNYDFFRP